MSNHEAIDAKDLEVCYIKPLSVFQASRIPEQVRNFLCAYWLLDEGTNNEYHNRVAYVDIDGKIHRGGDFVGEKLFVRPVIHPMPNAAKRLNLEPGTTVKLTNGTTWYVLPSNALENNGTQLLCMDRCFGVAPYSNEESVKWEGSNLQHHMRNTYSDSVYQWDNDKKEIIIYSKFTDDNLMV